jgi:hypothetical protein
VIIDVKFQEQDKRVEATLAQNESAVNTNFGEFQKVPATANHNDLTGREYENQHPISAISGLQEELDNKQPKDNYLKQTDLQKAVDDALSQAKASGEFDGADGFSPIVSLSKSGKVTTLEITDKNGKKKAEILDGKDGKDGYTPIKGVDYFDGAKGEKGERGADGAKGEKGADGYTPIKGTDYYTEADKTEMVQAVITALPKYNGEVIAV